MQLPLIHILQGELAHRVVKRLYALTNRRDATKQIVKHYRREEGIRHETFDTSDGKQNQEEIPAELHHHISASKNHPLSIATFILENPGDPAKEVCSCHCVCTALH